MSSLRKLFLVVLVALAGIGSRAGAPPIAGPATALEFYGTDHITGPSISLANRSFSIEFWMRRGQTGKFDSGFSVGTSTGPDRGLYIGFRTDNTFTMQFGGGDDLNTPVYTDLNWHHWAATFDAPTKAQKIYRDGVLVATRTSTGLFQGDTTSVIGGLAFALNPFKGELADLRVWYTVRSATEIANNRHGNLLSTTDGLILNYRFNEGSGTTLYDVAASTSLPDQQGAQNVTMLPKFGFLGADAPMDRSIQLSRSSGQKIVIPGLGNKFSEYYHTFEFWVRIDAPGQTIFQLVGNSNNRMSLTLPGADGTIVFAAGVSGGTDMTYTPSSSAPPAGRWEHWAFVNNFGPYYRKIYRNGVLVKNEIYALPFANGYGGDLELSFNGRLADFRIWNVERTATEIEDNRYRPVPGNSPGLLVNFLFNENAGAGTVVNASTAAGAINGTVTGSPYFSKANAAALRAMPEFSPLFYGSEDAVLPVYLPAGDPDSTVNYSSVTAANGTLAQVAGGNFNYVPTSSVIGSDTITYVTSENSISSTGRVNVAILPAFDPPTVGAGASVNLNQVGTGQFLDVPDGVWFGSTWTVEGWVNVRSHANWSRFFDFGNDSGAQNVIGALSRGTSGFPALWVYKDGSPTAIESSQALPLNTWKHVAFTRDAGGMGRIFIDGVQTASGALGLPNSVTRTNNYFGKSNWAVDALAAASFAELRIWNVARSAQELTGASHVSLAENTAGLVAYYKLNEGSGTAALDSATGDGTQNAAVVNRAPWMRTDGPTNSLAFNGSTQMARRVDGTQLSITGAITLEAWIKPASVGSSMGIIEKYNAVNGGYVMRLSPSGYPEFYLLDNHSVWTALAAKSQAPVGAWTHVAAVWDGSQMQIYINGVYDNAMFSTRNPKDGASDLLIGAVGSPEGSYKYNGRVGDVRIWNVARSGGDISAGLGGVATSASGLVANYKFATGSLAADSATGDGAQDLVLEGAPAGAVETGLAVAQSMKYTEDTAVTVILPTRDVDSGTLIYVSQAATSGTLTFVSGKTFTYTPAPNFNGPVTLTFTVSDSASATVGRIYLQGLAVDDAPTLVATETGLPVANQTVGEGSTTRQINLSVTDGDPELTQAMTITAVSSDTTLIRNPLVTYTSPNETAQISFKPRPGMSGTATITLTATDAASQSTVRSFVVTVTPVDDPPSAGPATALQFTANNYAQVPGYGAVVPRDEITIEFWQKALTAGTHNSVTTSPYDAAAAIRTTIPNAAGFVVWEFGNSTAAGRLAYTPPANIIGTWQHFAFVASKSGSYMKIFRNGIEEATKPGMTSFPNSVADLQLGHLPGALAEFRVWNVARTAEEIQAAMHSGLTNNTPNLVTYYRFNQNPTTVLKDFASLDPLQLGGQDGQLVDVNDIDPIWLLTVGSPVWQTSDAELKALQVIRVAEGASIHLQLPGWDAEDGEAATWQNVSASVGTATALNAAQGVWTYTAPEGFDGAATLNYQVRDSSLKVSAGSLNLRVVTAINLNPTIDPIANVAAEEDTPLIEIPFTVNDDQPAANLIITPVVLSNAEFVQTPTVSAGGSFRTLTVIPNRGEIGTVHIRLLAQDAGGKVASREFDLRIESKPAFKVFDMGVVPGKVASFGTAINDRGAVTGYMADTADLVSNPVGFFFNGIENGGVVESNPITQVGPSPLATPFRPMAINNDYMLAGSARNVGQTIAWKKDIQESIVNLGAFGLGSSADARALNDAGKIAGFGVIAGDKRAFSYAPGDASLTSLGVAAPPFDKQSEAFGINSLGHIVGGIYNPAGARRAMIYKDNAMVPLFDVPDDTNSVAQGINKFDQVVGSATTFTTGDGALSFDGVDDTLTQGSVSTNPDGVALPSGNAPHTIEAWIKLDGLPTTKATAIRVGNAAAGNHVWNVTSTGQLEVGNYGGGTMAVMPLTVGLWAQVAATYDPVSSTLKLYRNGQLANTATITALNVLGIPMTLGGNQPGPNLFKGAMDEVRVWKAIRSDAQILENYNKRVSETDPNLVVYYPFGEGIGTSSTSAAAGALVASSTGNPVWTVRRGLLASDISVSEAALQLDGATAYATGPAIALDSRSFSIEFRARRNRLAVDETIFWQGAATANSGLSIGFKASNKFALNFWDNEFETTDVFNDTNWHHWAVTVNVTNSQRRIFCDGVMVEQGFFVSPYVGTGGFTIGNLAGGSLFSGVVDDLRIWQVVRTPEQIAANVDTRIPMPATGLAANYTFDEGGGTIAADRVAGGAPLDLHGTSAWTSRDSGTLRAFMYETSSGRLKSLGTVAGGGASEALAINEFGQVVGSAVQGANTKAFFFSAGKMNSLYDLLPEADQLDQWTLDTAVGINRSGAIVGTGFHKGLKRAYLAAPATIIGRAVIRPAGAVERMPGITILKKVHEDDSAANCFFWSDPEKKLYAIRPVIAKLEWFVSMSDTIGVGENTTVIAERVVSVSVNVWPKDPIIHIAGAPVNLEPTYTAENYTFQSLIYNPSAAGLEPSARVFTCVNTGYTVVYYLKTDGQTPNPGTQRPYFDVIRTVPWTDSRAKLVSQNWTIGTEVVDPAHAEYEDRNGYVLFEKAAYDAVGADASYDRGARLGPILPVNTEKPGGNVLANPDPLVVVWYRTNRIGVAWASAPIRYSLQWPADETVDRIIIAQATGSGDLSELDFPAKTIYHQADIGLPGFNPNEEHALMSGDTLFAVRDDLNAIKNYSEPYALLKYRDPDTSRWRMRVYKVVAEQAPYYFVYAGTVGKEIQPPMPLSLLPLRTESYQRPGSPAIGWEDYKGKIYARMAGPDGTHADLVIRWFYPMQPGFYHPDGSVKPNDPIAWLDRRAPSRLVSPNASAGVSGTPIDVTYDIRWDDHHVLQIGETLLHAKHGLPDVFSMANAQVIFDSLNPIDPASQLALTRFYDPISPRTLKTGVKIPGAIKRENISGKEYFSNLPWMLKLRLVYDPINNWLSFNGHLDENFGVGEPLLLPNVLTARERDTIKKLADGDSAWSTLIDRLANLTRNPNGVDLTPVDGTADVALRIGLTTVNGVVVAETFGSGPKALTAGIGGVPPAQYQPGRALNFDGAGVVNVGPFNGQSINLAGTPFTIEFWAKITTPTAAQYIVGQPDGAPSNGRLRIGIRHAGEFAFDLGTSAESMFTTTEKFTSTEWTHWACVFNPETGVQSIYRNGVLVESRSVEGLAYTGAGTFELGRSGTEYFGGQLDEVRVWKSARTAAQIRLQMSKRLLGAQSGAPLGAGTELNLELLYRCDDASGPLVNASLATAGGYFASYNSHVTRVTSTAPAGIPPRYITVAENNDAALAGLPVALHVIRIDDGPFLGDLKVLPGENVFDERLTIRHSSDFGGDPNVIEFQWFFKPIGAGFDPTDLPTNDPTVDVLDVSSQGWTPIFGNLGSAGINYGTIGEGGESGLITLSDNAFIVRYRGYRVGPGPALWSGWVGDPTGSAEQPRAALAEGWVKRVVRGLNPFDARTTDFHSSPASTFSSMLIQAGQRYEGPIAFNPAADAINKVGLVEAYQTVLNRARGLSIDGVPAVDFNPANAAIQLASTKLSDLYMVLGNEAYADASDPTIGFGISSLEYGSLASSIFAFQNQLDSLLEEELALLRGRDDSAAGVNAPPIYNRLFWNFTLGEGEVAYQQNYNVSDQDVDGFITEKDARILFPQGHGDAWGHYLTAMRQQYTLLRHPMFTWIPRSEFVSVAGAAIKVDFLDERKFANAAAAKAKAGAEIVDLTYRLNYVDDPNGQWQGYKDSNTDRAWGVSDWGRRAGMGAYLDWVVANTILPSVDPNPAHTGIDKIDRKTVRELNEIAAHFDEIQTRMDQADSGLNPLGLAKGVVPFDIDPSQVAAGKTHFEQIQERALKAMSNAAAVWDEANKATELMRRTQDSVEQFTQNSIDHERDLKNRLIEVFGYPYAGDIGPGKTYPNNYDGPDLYHYMYVRTTEYTGEPAQMEGFNGFFSALPFSIPSEDTTQNLANAKYFPGDVGNPKDAILHDNAALQVDFPFSSGNWGFAAPPAWGIRRAPGEIQIALQDWVEQDARLKQSTIAYGNLIREISDAVYLLHVKNTAQDRIISIREDTASEVKTLGRKLSALKAVEQVLTIQTATMTGTLNATVEAMPKVVGLATDALSGIRSIALYAGAIAKSIYGIAFAGIKIGQVAVQQDIITAQNTAVIEIDKAHFTVEDQVALNHIANLFRKEAVLRAEIFTQSLVLEQNQGRYFAAVAKGQRLIEERVAFRKRVSAQTTESRYRDMTFRIFRNDALQKYRAAFDLAQRYVYLAATAYDYESNLLGTDTRSGRAFLTDIIRQRSIGQLLNGQPIIGRAGLSDPFARMSANFDVLKSQLGFNNPQTETSRFSLRSELFRLHDSSEEAWRGQLSEHRVANLWDLPEFRRYCRSFAPESAGAQPGIVIRFPSSVLAGQNFFKWPLGGGDSAYDPSRFATKIRSAGVWFSGYNGLGLSQTPRIYLVPAGADVLTSPTPNDFTTREWRVVDQALPTPFPIGANRLNDPSWVPINDSLGGSFAEIRRFASFRAYHDSGVFEPEQVTSDSRLIGRSVWNTDWMLIIPGQTFLANSNNGLDAFINSVDDVKIFFQTYSYSGN